MVVVVVRVCGELRVRVGLVHLVIFSTERRGTCLGCLCGAASDKLHCNGRTCELVPRTVTHLEEAEQGLRINGAEVCQRAHLGEDSCELESEPEIVRMLRR